MRPKCPVCGKLFWCDWPNLWRYKRDGAYLCSWEQTFYPGVWNSD